jgi:hypothetical protein
MSDQSIQEKFEEVIVAAERAMPILARATEFASYSSSEYQAYEKLSQLVEEYRKQQRGF